MAGAIAWTLSLSAIPCLGSCELLAFPLGTYRRRQFDEVDSNHAIANPPLDLLLLEQMCSLYSEFRLLVQPFCAAACAPHAIPQNKPASSAGVERLDQDDLDDEDSNPCRGEEERVLPREAVEQRYSPPTTAAYRRFSFGLMRKWIWSATG